MEVARLIHEPTAACLTAARERRLTGPVVVVDLGAGTLDVSLVDVDEEVHDVQQVLGDNHYGGRDFDVAVSKALTARLERQGVRVPPVGPARRRLDIAAEALKVRLSSQEHADYLLPSFIDEQTVRLELSRADLVEILAEPLAKLHATCAEFKHSLPGPAKHLVLVGQPMLSPLVQQLIENVFGLRRTAIADPRTTVACGAALQAAVLDGRLRETLLLEVTPLDLGIRALDDKGEEIFDTLIQRNTKIPTSQSEIYGTQEDNQAKVNIEIFNGQMASESKIGQFQLTGIRPAPRGEPKIEVTFSIDVNCLLMVTACDKDTGQSKSILISDTTLLSPNEIAAMTRSYQEERNRAEQKQMLVDLRATLRGLIEEIASSDSEAAWREFRSRLAAHRPTKAPLPSEDHQLLVEMFNEANQRELDLELAWQPLRRLAAEASEYLALDHNEDLATQLADAKRLSTELHIHLDGLRLLMAKVARWNALLVRLALIDPDPLQRFRNQHDAGDYHQALDAFDQLATPVKTVTDIERLLHCCAEVSDSDRYRDTLPSNSTKLGAVLLDPTRPQTFLSAVRPALGWIEVATPDGVVRGRGFLTKGGLLATNRHLLIDPATGQQVPTKAIRVTINQQTKTVADVSLAETASLDVALLHFAEPATAAPPRFGHSNLVRIGDTVWVASYSDLPALLPGIVDKFELFPEQNLHVFKLGMRLPAECTGSPLFNDLGEVVGILAIRDDGVQACSH